MVTFRERKAKYCNIKLLLIFLVVYGHMIETAITYSGIAEIIYQYIYLVHMLAFIYITGYFVHSKTQCRILLKRYAGMYLIIQGIMILTSRIEGIQNILAGDTIHNIRNLHLFYPYWHLWYLLSLVAWLGVAQLWFTLKDMAEERKPKITVRGKVLCIVMLAVCGCLVGKCNQIGRVMSLSRTIVYLPYFIAGLFTSGEKDWKRYRIPAVILMVTAVIVLQRFIWDIPYQFLWQADSYDKLFIKAGEMKRLLCYLAGGILVFGILTGMPEKRSRLSMLGTDTLPVYVAHPYVLLLFKNRGLMIKSNYQNILTTVTELLAGLLMGFIVMVTIYQFHRFRKKICCIQNETQYAKRCM